jgi:CBS domain-containing protein
MHRFRFSGVPITDDAGRLVGILTNRDIRFCEPADFDRPVSDFMTSDRLITASVGTTLEQAKQVLQKHRIEKLPLVDDEGFLRRPHHGEGHPEAPGPPERHPRLEGSSARAPPRSVWATTSRTGSTRCTRWRSTPSRSTPRTATRPVW